MLPGPVGEMVDKAVSPQAALAITQSWDVTMLLIGIAGAVTVITALQGIYKKYKYNRPDYGEYKIMMLVFGVLMVNMGHVIEIFARTLGFGQ